MSVVEDEFPSPLVIGHCKALYDYDAVRADELSIKAGLFKLLFILSVLTVCVSAHEELKKIPEGLQKPA